MLIFESQNNLISFNDKLNKLKSYNNITTKLNESVVQKNILYAFDMDDTLVYSKRFEEHIRPLLIKEYLTPEIILNNKLEEIGIGIENLKYSDGRIYFNDINHNFDLPINSSWVRKKSRVYLIQPDTYFMTDESMPIGTYNNIVNIYNKSKNRCIITARNERIKSKVLKSLKNLNLKIPNKGLFMYPIGSFKYVYEYKADKLLELYNSGYNEIHYFDDNIKILKKIKSILQNSDINITYYKVTKNKIRKL